MTCVVLSLSTIVIAQSTSIHDTSLDEIISLEKSLTKKIESYRQGGSHSNYSYGSFNAAFFRYKSGEIKRSDFDKYLQEWYAFHESLQKEYDRVFILRHAYIVKKARNDLDNFLIRENVNRVKYKSSLSEIDRAYQEWLPLAECMGGYGDEAGRQRKRHDSFYNFIKSLIKFYKSFPNYKGDYYKLYEAPLYQHAIKEKSCLSNVVDPVLHSPFYLIQGFGFIGAVVSASFDLVVKNKRGTLFVPFTKKADYMMQTIRKSKGLHLNIKNRHLLPRFARAASREVYLILPAHQIGMLDAFLTAELGLPHYLIFSHPMAFAPNKILAQSLANHPQFISVGVKAHDGQGSMEQLNHALSNGHGNIIVNYPQGQLEPSHVQPINGNFSEKMLLKLVKDGYKINILPMMWHVPSTFPNSHFGLPSKFPLNSFSGEVLPKLEPALVNYLISKEYDQDGSVNPRYDALFSKLVRSIWIEHKTVFKDLQLKQMLKRMDAMIPA